MFITKRYVRKHMYRVRSRFIDANKMFKKYQILNTYIYIYDVYKLKYFV